MKKVLIDSSSLISLSINCLLNIVRQLSQQTGVKFLITEFVRNEVVNNALEIERFMLSGIRLSKLLKQGFLEVVDLDYNSAKRLLNTANSIYEVEGRPVRIVHKGEMQAVVAALKQDCKCMIIDERVTSTLIEDHYELKSILESRLHKPVTINEKALRQFKSETNGLMPVKSSDLLAIAYEKGLLKDYSLDNDSFGFLKASLWGLKYAGCALTNKEISDYLKHVRQI